MSPTSIKKLPIGTHPLTTYPGLRMVVSTTCRSWSYRFRDGRNKLKQVKLGEWPAMSLAGAVSKWEAARQQKALPAKVTHTVKELIDAYCVEHLQVRRKLASNRVDMLYRHIGDLWNVEAAGVGRTEAHRLLQGLTDKPSIQRLMKVELAACWNHAIDSGRLTSEFNPWQRQKVAPVGARQRVFSDSELRDLLKWLPNSKLTAGMRRIFMLVLLTGARAGEVCGMRVTALDLNKGEWQLAGEDTKTGVGRVVALNSWAVEILHDQLREAPLSQLWVFPNRAGTGAVKQPIYSNALWHAREDCPISGWVGHDGRRTCRTGLAKLGCPDAVGEAMLGHASKGVVGVYQVYRYGKEQREWAEKWGQHLSQLVTK